MSTSLGKIPTQLILTTYLDHVGEEEAESPLVLNVVSEDEDGGAITSAVLTLNNEQGKKVAHFGLRMLARLLMWITETQNLLVVEGREEGQDWGVRSFRDICSGMVGGICKAVERGVLQWRFGGDVRGLGKALDDKKKVRDYLSGRLLKVGGLDLKKDIDTWTVRAPGPSRRCFWGLGVVVAVLSRQDYGWGEYSAAIVPSWTSLILFGSGGPPGVRGR